MKNVILFFAVIVFCFLMNSCRIENMVWLESYRPKVGFIDKWLVSEQQDTVFFHSSWHSNHPKLYEPDWEENDLYPIYNIRCLKRVKPYCIRLESISITECGEPIPISVFYEPHIRQTVMIDSIPFTYNPCCAGYDNFYVKIKKRTRDIREMTIHYRISIDGMIIEEEHQYRRAHEIRTKHHILYHRWLRTCNE